MAWYIDIEYSINYLYHSSKVIVSMHMLNIPGRKFHHPDFKSYVVPLMDLLLLVLPPIDLVDGFFGLNTYSLVFFLLSTDLSLPSWSWLCFLDYHY